MGLKFFIPHRPFPFIAARRTLEHLKVSEKLTFRLFPLYCDATVQNDYRMFPKTYLMIGGY